MENGASSYRRFLEGDDAGIVEIIKDYKDGLVLYLNGYVRNIHVAEELMEDTFFKIVTKRPKFSGKSSFKTWLYAIGRNTATDYLRRARRHSDISFENCENFLEEEINLEKSYIREENKIMVHRALKNLKLEYRQILYLINFENFSNAQAAMVMKKSRHQIENFVYRAKKVLRLELNKDLSVSCWKSCQPVTDIADFYNLSEKSKINDADVAIGSNGIGNSFAEFFTAIQDYV